ncbi:MAG: hypothetical protein DCC71_04065 [Proteobacteria bacterium]|nr:MAG: hypothetical protein DCC71_04065 [Pseudomonadota bacterium]
MSRDVSLLACPKCGASPLGAAPDALACAACGASFPIVDGIPDLLVGERFSDESGCDVWENEEKTGRFLASNYLLPLVQRLFPGRDPRSLRVLSIGCGVGSDVEVLGAAGYEAYGVDAGGRPQLWRRRSHPERFFFANAKHLPFRDERFDFVFLCCVIPHIGVVGDTYVTAPGYAEERQRAWDEALRVLKPGGQIMLSAPNKRCPLDLFHRKFHWVHLPRVHSPFEGFLLSVGEYREQLVARGGCRDFEVLPLEGYWGFFISSGYWLGRLLQLPIRLVFKLMTWEATRWLRGTFLNPWLVVRAQKG